MAGKPPTVLFLGAGASHDTKYKLPTMSQFFEQDMFGDSINEPGGQKREYPSLRRFLTEQFGMERKANLEEVISHLYGSLDSALPIRQERRRFLASAQEELGRYMLERFARKPPGCQPTDQKGSLFPWKFACCTHRKVFATMKPDKDAILSINYDMIADGTLSEMQDWEAIARTRTDELNSGNWPAINPSHPAVTKVRYIKLHGSLDSVTCHNPLCARYHIIQKRTKIGGLKADGSNGICGTCGSPVGLGVVPPVISKSSQEWRTGLDWSLAFYRLVELGRWILWGISLAESDHQLRSLLREAAYESRRQRSLEVIVINPCAIAAERVKNVVQSRVLRYCDVTHYLAGREPCIVD
ncbi:MAG: hypothetical protein ACYTEQ_28560 [Planctomycetota bacterium]